MATMTTSAPGLITDLAIVLVAAGLVTAIFRRLRQPIVLGYILAGILIGPHLLEPGVVDHEAGLISDAASIETLGGLGVVFLLFSLGLDFHLSRLRRMGMGALVAGCLEIPLMLWAGTLLGTALGWSSIDSLFLGAVVSISSTTIVVKLLAEMERGQEPFAQLIYAVLVVEDLLAVLILAALSTLATTGSASVAGLASKGIGVVLFVVLIAAVGRMVVPGMVRRLTEARAREVLIVGLMAVLFAVCLVALEAGYSVALGAFLAGAVVGETKHVRRVETIVEPLRDVFCAVFFVAVGLHIDPSEMASLWVPILAGTGLVIFGKVAACTFGAFVAGYDLRTALRAGMGLGQIGEFSFVIAQLGLSLGVVSAPLYSIAVGISLITALITPYLMRSSDRIVEVFLRRAPAPLVTYTELYGRWVAGLTAEGVGAQVWSVARKPILQALLNVLAVSAILFGGRTLAGTMAGGGAPLDRTAEGLVWGGAFLIAMPFLIAAWRKVRAISLILAEGALAGRNLPEARALALRSLLANTGSLIAGIVLGAWLLAASAPFLPPVPMTIGIAAFLAVLTAVLYRWMVRFQAGIQAGFQRLAAPRPDQARGSTSPGLELMRRYYPYGGGAAEIVIPHGSPVTGRTLRDLSLRTATGATIVLIERGDRRLIDPVDAPLAEGDRLLVMGEEDQIARARAVLESREPAPSGSAAQRPRSG